MQLYIVKGTASLEAKSCERNRELENFASLETRICEVLLYLGIFAKLRVIKITAYNFSNLISQKRAELGLEKTQN